jgi:transposase-like protein
MEQVRPNKMLCAKNSVPPERVELEKRPDPVLVERTRGWYLRGQKLLLWLECSSLRLGIETKLGKGGTSLHKVSRETGVSMPTLIKWRKAERQAASLTEPINSTQRGSSVEDENNRLRKEVEQLREERDYLRRTLARLIGLNAAD